MQVLTSSVKSHVVNDRWFGFFFQCQSVHIRAGAATRRPPQRTDSEIRRNWTAVQTAVPAPVQHQYNRQT